MSSIRSINGGIVLYYQAFNLKPLQNNAMCYQILQSAYDATKCSRDRNHSDFLIKIPDASGKFEICISTYVPYTVGVENEAYIMNFILALVPENIEEYPGVTDLIIPCVEYEGFQNVKFLKGMKIAEVDSPIEFTVNQVKQKTKFEMNKDGVTVKSAFAMTTTFNCYTEPNIKKILKVERPFLMWINDPAYNPQRPITYAFFNYDDWTIAKG